MKVVVGSDHAGFALKEHLKKMLAQWGHEVEDVGTHSTESTDYPDWGAAVGHRTVENKTLGVAVCGSGIGISIAANKVAGVRAALVSDSTAARLAREHNDANVLCLGERLVGPAVAEAEDRAWSGAATRGRRAARTRRSKRFVAPASRRAARPRTSRSSRAITTGAPGRARRR
jgi:ribose 5-phosphate isomerase B